jgi:flagellar motility protein MotE (MotC chaperone)
MRYKVLLPLAAIKILALVLWLYTGHDILPTPVVYAASSTPAVELDRFVLKEPVVLKSSKERSMIEAIKRREVELDVKEEDLKLKEERLGSLKKDLDAKIVELNKMQAKYESLIVRVEEARSERVKKTVKIYESMAPAEAAPRLEKLNEKLAVQILAKMNAKKAGRILGIVQLDKAVKLTHMLKIRQIK